MAATAPASAHAGHFSFLCGGDVCPVQWPVAVTRGQSSLINFILILDNDNILPPGRAGPSNTGPWSSINIKPGSCSWFIIRQFRENKERIPAFCGLRSASLLTNKQSHDDWSHQRSAPAPQHGATLSYKVANSVFWARHEPGDSPASWPAPQ